MRSMIAFSLGRQTIISIFGRYKSAPSVFQTAKRQVSRKAKKSCQMFNYCRTLIKPNKRKREKSCQKKCGHSLNLFFLDSNLSVAHDFSGQDDKLWSDRPEDVLVCTSKQQQKKPITRSSRSKPKSVSIMMMMIISISIHHNYRQNCKLPIVQLAFAFDGIRQHS